MINNLFLIKFSCFHFAKRNFFYVFYWHCLIKCVSPLFNARYLRLVPDGMSKTQKPPTRRFFLAFDILISQLLKKHRGCIGNAKRPGCYKFIQQRFTKGTFLRSFELENSSPGSYLIKISLELSLIRTIPYL